MIDNCMLVTSSAEEYHIVGKISPLARSACRMKKG